MSLDVIKDALLRLHYGFYSVTSRSGEDTNAMVANWVTQVSFEPRLIALGLQKTSYTHRLVEKSNVFAVNIFVQDDAGVIKAFTKGRAKNPAKMENASFTPGPETGCPVLAGAAAFIECTVVAIHDDGGDHDIVVGKVVNAGILKPGDASQTLTLPKLGWSYAG